MPTIVGGLDIHRKQLTFDYLDLVTGEVKCGHVAPADREHFRSWLARFENPAEVAFAAEACTGWRYVTEELQRAGMQAHLAEPADTAAARGRKRRAKTDRAKSASKIEHGTSRPAGAGRLDRGPRGLPRTTVALPWPIKEPDTREKKGRRHHCRSRDGHHPKASIRPCH
jgi:hypothetical protein